jgi:hypothetical protein
VSELLDRIRREIRERLEASRAAMHEHERLEAALHALGDAGARTTRAVRGSGRRPRAPARPSSPAAKPSSRKAPARKQSPAAAGAAERGAAARARSAASAQAGQPSSASNGGAGQTARRRAGRATPSAGAKQGQGARAAASAAPARKRAPRGANRQAVLSVISDRPGVTARELAAVSGVTGGTLYSLLRTLTQRGTVEKRELPGGQTGYSIAPSDGAQTTAVPARATTEGSAGADPGPAAQPQQDRAGPTQTDDARSARTENRATDDQGDGPAAADETSAQDPTN